ncbi:hypothetical protein F0Q45_14755 [Mycobacterium simiae]|uniref:Uncharacterized protein n=1 Tax=Mycobacterium simiae TaxID=1784 RepID=A0A5B1BPZ1_MYCSI|nr:hypothetical protein [Mycobacterium simiae]KAA1249510.1 hypothetical protein F0Q45_14755 [Mycobacterium simiae]
MKLTFFLTTREVKRCMPAGVLAVSNPSMALRHSSLPPETLRSDAALDPAGEAQRRPTNLGRNPKDSGRQKITRARQTVAYINH